MIKIIISLDVKTRWSPKAVTVKARFYCTKQEPVTVLPDEGEGELVAAPVPVDGAEHRPLSVGDAGVRDGGVGVAGGQHPVLRPQQVVQHQQRQRRTPRVHVDHQVPQTSVLQRNNNSCEN